jgi:hypothetical protein
MGGRNASINSETPKKISDALEEVKESIIARTDTVRSLSYYTPESEGSGFEEDGPYGEDNINTNKNCFCWRERDLEKRSETSAKEIRAVLLTRLTDSPSTPENA